MVASRLDSCSICSNSSESDFSHRQFACIFLSASRTKNTHISIHMFFCMYISNLAPGLKAKALMMELKEAHDTISYCPYKSIINKYDKVTYNVD